MNNWVQTGRHFEVQQVQLRSGFTSGEVAKFLPASAIADATSFWVEKMLQAAHRTVAPSATSVSINTCREIERKRIKFLEKWSKQCQVQGVSKKERNGPEMNLILTCNPHREDFPFENKKAKGPSWDKTETKLERKEFDDGSKFHQLAFPISSDRSQNKFFRFSPDGLIITVICLVFQAQSNDWHAAVAEMSSIQMPLMH